MKKFLEKSLAYINANLAYKSVLVLLLEKADLKDFLYACQNVHEIPQPPPLLESVQTFTVTSGKMPSSPWE